MVSHGEKVIKSSWELYGVRRIIYFFVTIANLVFDVGGVAQYIQITLERLPYFYLGRHQHE